VLWIDDRIAHDLQRHLEGSEHISRLSWVVPDAEVGLSSHELDLIEKWAADGEQVRSDVLRERQATAAAARLADLDDGYED
jgi:ribosomal protein L14E/L6E/L27E